MNLLIRLLGTGIALVGGAALAWIGGASARPSLVQLGPAGLSAPRVATAPLFSDWELSPEGNIHGLCLDAVGRPMAGATVELRRRDAVIAQTQTDRVGGFQLTDLRGGTYRIGRAGAWTAIRLWTAHTAPPSARVSPLVVRGEVSTNSSSAIEAAYGVAPSSGPNLSPTPGALAAAIVTGARDQEDEPRPFELEPASN